MQSQGGTFDVEADVVIVGSGAAGMVAALTVQSAGLETLVIDKASVFGGSTALSGGALWVPNAPQFGRPAGGDDERDAYDYLVRIIGDTVSHDRIRQYLEQAPRMVEFLEELSPYFRNAFFRIEGYPDYFPDKGGSRRGRSLWPVPIDRRLLGADEPLLRPGNPRIRNLPRGMWLTGVDLHSINRIRWGVSIGPYRTLLRLVWRATRARILGERIVANGAALVTRLRLAMQDAGIRLWLQTPMTALVSDDSGRVIGVVVQRDGKVMRIRSRHGVVLATGGFEHNSDMRSHYQPTVGKGWSVGSPDNKGDGHRAAQSLGAAFDLMDGAWWFPVIMLPTGIFSTVAERQYPGQFIVNALGKRFANEASPYSAFGRKQILAHETGISHIPAWMIIDNRAWTHNIICAHFPGLPMPKEWLQSGMVKKARTMAELAAKIGVPAGALLETADRFNRFARAGRDEDFSRGESAYDNYYGDPSLPNPNLMEVSRPPFYAFQIYPGDLGTNGGLRTDKHGRVLRSDGTCIDGLYASGNVAASVMGRSYAGPGATIGPAMAFGYIAARVISDNRMRELAGQMPSPC